MDQSLDINDELEAALAWANKHVPCEGCADGAKVPHSPVCLMQATITTGRGAHGRVVIENPHPSLHANS